MLLVMYCHVSSLYCYITPHLVFSITSAMRKRKSNIQEESNTFQSKRKVYSSLTETHTAFICTHKYRTGLQFRVVALFLSLRRQTPQHTLLKEKLICSISSYSPLIRPRPSLDRGKVGSCLRQHNSDASDVHFLQLNCKQARCCF